MARILIVEDEFLVAMSHEFTLTDAGHQVRIASNGREAIAILNEFRPKVVVTDYMMPMMDGAELIDRLRANPATSGIGIILASAIPSDMLEARVTGYDVHLAKPLRDTDLLAAVETLAGSDSS